jgi:uncharacterized membrane protein YidH (DUF202 family)
MMKLQIFSALSFIIAVSCAIDSIRFKFQSVDEAEGEYKSNIYRILTAVFLIIGSILFLNHRYNVISKS